MGRFHSVSCVATGGVCQMSLFCAAMLTWWCAIRRENSVNRHWSRSANSKSRHRFSKTTRARGGKASGV